MLPFTSQAIRKHLRDRGVGAGVAPEFMAKRNSELIDIRDGTPPTPSVSRLAMSRAAMDLVPRPCFALAEGARLGPGQISGLGRERPSRQECRNGDIPAAAFLSPRVFARLCIRADPWRGPPRAPVANGG
jgi:hypothetical protein